MITFETWLPQIVGYCHLVVDRERLRRAWIDHDVSTTSVTDFDELYEQIFDDLDSNLLQLELPKYFVDDAAVTNAITEFLEALRNVDKDRSKNEDLMKPKVLIASAQWLSVENAARAVLREMESTGG